MRENERDFSELIHEVYSRGSAIEEAAELMQKASPEERIEMLRLMEEQARSLADCISKYANASRIRETVKP